MFARRHSKLISLFGLLAILMATLAPTISHLLAAGRATAPLCTTQTVTAASQAGNQDRRHIAAPGTDDCGYCSLLAHMPAVPPIPARFAVTVRAIAHSKATRSEAVRLACVATAAQPRAPPAPDLDTILG
jgi:hypothetical protein